MIGGMVIGIFLTLFVVPAIYSYVSTEGVKMVEIEKQMEEAVKEAG